MAKVEGRRPDETAQPSSQRTGPESWALLIGLILAIAAVAVIVGFASGVGL